MTPVLNHILTMVLWLCNASVDTKPLININVVNQTIVNSTVTQLRE